MAPRCHRASMPSCLPLSRSWGRRSGPPTLAARPLWSDLREVHLLVCDHGALFHGPQPLLCWAMKSKEFHNDIPLGHPHGTLSDSFFLARSYTLYTSDCRTNRLIANNKTWNTLSYYVYDCVTTRLYFHFYGVTEGMMRTIFLCVSQASSMHEDWCANAWPRPRGMPGPEGARCPCLLQSHRISFPKNRKKEKKNEKVVTCSCGV